MKPSIKISVPALAVRNGWANLDDLPWDAAEILEIVQRYCDAQDHAKNYRHRRAAKDRLLKSTIEGLAKSAGLSVEEYLEIETQNVNGQ